MDNPHDAQPVATIDTIPAPRVNFSPPCLRKKFSFLITIVRFSPKRVPEINKRIRSIPETVPNDPQKRVQRMLILLKIG